jgi:predicted regulator of Ras-like GTPase activity (Roadblock/LC7/MglB family)
MAKLLKDALKEFLNIDGVRAVAIVGRDGFVIESVSADKLDTDALGAVVASSIGASEMIGKDFSLGKLDQYLLEFSNGKAIIASAGNDILTLITDANAVIGSVRYAVKKGIDGLVSIL